LERVRGPARRERRSALPIDVEDDVAAARERRFDRRLCGSVSVAEHECVLGELAAPDHVLEPVGRDAVIVAAVDLAGADRGGGVRHAELELRELGEQSAGEGRLARTGGRRNDHQDTAIGHRGIFTRGYVARHHSTFWTCSRTFSRTALASTIVELISASV